MRRRLLASSAVLAALVVAPASARADVGRFIPGEPIDAPAEAIHGVDLDIARDGTGGVVYVKSVGAVDHVFASRLQGGVWQPPEQLDAGLPASSQPVIAAGDGGKLAVAFVSGGSLFAMVKAAADQPYTPPQLVSSPAINPSIDLSVNDVAYLSFTNPAGGGGGDVVVARKDRKATAFGVVPAALDINPAAPAGIDTGRSKVAVAADGVALVGKDPLGEVTAITLKAMLDGTWPRLKVCRKCEWAFYDYSKNRSGSWCSMQLCGNRLKTRAYRSRRARV